MPSCSADKNSRQRGGVDRGSPVEEVRQYRRLPWGDEHRDDQSPAPAPFVRDGRSLRRAVDRLCTRRGDRAGQNGTRASRRPAARPIARSARPPERHRHPVHARCGCRSDRTRDRRHDGTARRGRAADRRHRADGPPAAQWRADRCRDGRDRSAADRSDRAVRRDPRDRRDGLCEQLDRCAGAEAQGDQRHRRRQGRGYRQVSRAEHRRSAPARARRLDRPRSRRGRVRPHPRARRQFPGGDAQRSLGRGERECSRQRPERAPVPVRHAPLRTHVRGRGDQEPAREPRRRRHRRHDQPAHLPPARPEEAGAVAIRHGQFAAPRRRGRSATVGHGELGKPGRQVRRADRGRL